MQAYTDASVGEGYAVHSYILMDDEKITLKGLMKSGIEKTHLAELTSVIALLLHCQRNSINNITINTDSKSILELKETSTKHGKFIIWMRYLLRLTGSSIRWISRKENKVADKMCRDAVKQLSKVEVVDFQPLLDTIPKVGYMKLKSCRGVVFERSFKKIDISSVDISKMEPAWQYYRSMVKKSSRKSIEDILNWGSEGNYPNTKKGRRYLIERFIVTHHGIEEINELKACHAFDFICE